MLTSSTVIKDLGVELCCGMNSAGVPLAVHPGISLGNQRNAGIDHLSHSSRAFFGREVEDNCLNSRASNIFELQIVACEFGILA